MNGKGWQRLAVIALLAVVVLGMAAGGSDFQQMLAQMGLFSWVVSYWMPWIITVVLLILAARAAFKMLEQPAWLRIVLAIVVPGALFGGAFGLNPIYMEDVSGGGQQLEANVFPDNTVMAYLNEHRPGFDGLVVIASHSCQHCQAAAGNLSILKEREPDRDVAVFLHTRDTARITEFATIANAPGLDYHLAPDRDGMLELCEGRFPAFFYFKNNDFSYAWPARNFGYAAYDQVEEGIQ